MPFGSALPGAYDELFQLPDDPYRAANRYGLSQAGLALLASAGSPNYGQSLAQAFGAWGSGRQQQLQQFQETANRRRLFEAQQASLERQQRAAEAAESKEMRRLEEAENERTYWLSLIPEGERGKYALAPTDAIKAAAQPKDPKTSYQIIDLGTHKVRVDMLTGKVLDRYEETQAPSAPTERVPDIRVIGNQLVATDKMTGQQLWTRDVPPEAAAGGGGLPRTAWAGILADEMPEADPVAIQRAASELAAAGGAGFDVDREALALGSRSGRVRVVPPGTPAPPRPEPIPAGPPRGAAPRPGPIPPATGAAPTSMDDPSVQLLSALPDDLRSDPRVAAAVQRGLAKGLDPQTIIDQILAAAGRL